VAKEFIQKRRLQMKKPVLFMVVILTMAMMLLTSGCPSSNSNSSGQNNTQGTTTPTVNSASQESSKVPNAYIYSGTLTFTIKQKYVPTYKNLGGGWIDDYSSENTMTAKVNFSNLRITPYIYGEGYYKEDFQYSGSEVDPQEKFNVQDSFSGSFDDFAILGDYVLSGSEGETGILISLVNPEFKDFPSPLSPYWTGCDSPNWLNNYLVMDMVNKRVLFFKTSGGTVNFSGHGFLSGDNDFFDYSGTLNLVLTRTE
jgi:hypothetical protein